MVDPANCTANEFGPDTYDTFLIAEAHNSDSHCMKVSSLSITNIKSFKNKEKIDFNDDFNAIIGPNGGGKSNLLDIMSVVLNHYFLHGYSESESGDQTRLQQNNTPNTSDKIEKYVNHESESSEIKIELKVSEEDIENINNILNNKGKIEQKIDLYERVPGQIDRFSRYASDWSSSIMSEGDVFEYSIEDYDIENPQDDAKQMYKEYLNAFHFFILIAEDVDGLELSPAYFYFSPYRGSIESSKEVRIQNSNYYSQLYSYLNSTSRDQTSAIELATTKLAQLMVSYQSNNSVSNTTFYQENEVRLIYEYLYDLGYGWDLEETHIYQNKFQMIIEKYGISYELDQLSSGETEIINILLGVLSTNVRNGVIIIDEPELHLHPRWQLELVELLKKLEDFTGNQFIFSTHSPSFITRDTIPNVKRIYMDDTGSSRGVSISKENLNDLDDLIHITKSHNNERMFFADHVILVEGISDRLIVQSLVDYYQDEQSNQEIVEVLEVEGKHELSKYENFLDELKVTHTTIADRDYAKEVADDKGRTDIGELFEIDYKKIDDEVLKDSSTKDRETLSKKIEAAIDSNSVERLGEVKEIWDHIKDRKTKFDESLDEEAAEQWEEFLRDCREEGMYILPYGEIEDHIPDKIASTERILEFTKEESFEEWMESSNDREAEALKSIVKEIVIPGHKSDFKYARLG